MADRIPGYPPPVPRSVAGIGRAVVIATILAAVVALTGCVREHHQASAARGDGTVEHGHADVQYAAAAHVLSRQAAEHMILGVSTNGAGFLLDGENADAQALKAGDVLVIKEVGARRILGTKALPDGSIIALTQRASLLESVDRARIQVSKPVRFGGAPLAALKPRPATLVDLLVAPADAQGVESTLSTRAQDAGTRDAYGNVLSGIKGAVIDGWKTDFTATPSADKLDLHLTLTRDVGGMKAVITGDGYLQNFNMDCDIDVERGSYQKLEEAFKNVNGVMNFTWEVASDTPGDHTDKTKIKLPGAIQVPLYKMLDGVPLFLEISAALIIEPALTGGKEFSRGSFRVTYDGYQNFNIKEGTIDSNGNVTGDIQFLEGQNISTLAPMGMVVAFAAPRIELTFGVSKILSFGDMKTAASKVDAATDFLAKELLSPEQYAAFKGSPVGQIGLSKAIDNALKSDAVGYFQFVSSAGMSMTGMSVVTPCTRHDIHLWAKVGVSAEVFGQQVGESSKDVYSKDLVRIDPPGTRLCEEAKS